MNVCCCDWFKKEADWPKAGQEEIVWETQTKRTLGKKEGGVSGVTSEMQRKQEINIPC